MDIFEYLHYGISAVLVFVGFKMLLSHYYAIRTDVSLAVIGSILVVTMVASAWHRKKPAPQQ
jgi:tellurite resistance protein TerC